MTKINNELLGNHINCDGCGGDIANHIDEWLRSVDMMEYVFERLEWVEVDNPELSDKLMHYCPKCQKEKGIGDENEVSYEELGHKYLISYMFFTDGFSKRVNFGDININLNLKFSPSDKDDIIGEIKEQCNLPSYTDVVILNVYKYE